MAVFVKAKFGYEVSKTALSSGSINEIAKSLGYNQDQTYSYLGDFDQNFQVSVVVVEVFTDNIIFVLADPTKGPLNKNKVDYFMRNFSVKEEFNSSQAETILTDGIQNQSLTIDFLARVLRIKDSSSDGVFFVESLGLYLYFNDGILTDYSAADGLNTWSRRWKEINPNFIGTYERQAAQYWGNRSDKIAKEINAQAEAWANIPHPHINEYLPIHTNRNGLVNYAMLEVCHYNKVIDFDQFEAINHGRYTEIPKLESPDVKTYQLDNFIYEFSPQGQFIDHYQLR